MHKAIKKNAAKDGHFKQLNLETNQVFFYLIPETI